MRVLLAGYVLGQGGVQSHLKWLSKALGEENVDVLVLSLGNQEASPIDLELLQALQNSKVQIVCCNPYPEQRFDQIFSRLQRLTEIAAIIKQFSPDAYLAVGLGWNLFIPPLLAGTKTRWIFHEVTSGIPTGWSDSRWAVCWWFDEVVGQSATVARTFAKRFGWKKPIPALPALPEPLEITASLPKPVHRAVGLGKVKAAFFSRLEPYKQAFWLVQQWSLLKDVLDELHIHGSGPEEPFIREYISAHELGDRVKCFGRYPEGQAYVDLLSSYDLTLLPTIGLEGAPLVLLESMACGVPFVAYGVGGIPDYGVNNPDVLVVPPAPAAFIEGVKQIAHSLTQGDIDQARLQQFYFDRYSYSVLQKAWLSYFCDRCKDKALTF